jgi:hypothetical protein
VLIVPSNVFNNLVVLFQINQLLIRLHLLFDQNATYLRIVLGKKKELFFSFRSSLSLLRYWVNNDSKERKNKSTIVLDDFIIKNKQNVHFEIIWKITVIIIEHPIIRLLLLMQHQQLDRVINVLFQNPIHHHEQNGIYVHFLIYG